MYDRVYRLSFIVITYPREAVHGAKGNWNFDYSNRKQRSQRTRIRSAQSLDFNRLRSAISGAAGSYCLLRFGLHRPILALVAVRHTRLQSRKITVACDVRELALGYFGDQT